MIDSCKGCTTAFVCGCVSYLISPVCTLYLDEKQLSVHIGWMGRHYLAALLCYTKEWRMGPCINVTVRASPQPLSTSRGVMLLSGLSLQPTESSVGFSGCLSHFLFLYLTSTFLAVLRLLSYCARRPVHHLSIEFDRSSYATLSGFLE